MPLPALLAPIAAVIGGTTARVALANVLRFGGSVIATTFKSRMAWGLAAVWGAQALVSGKADSLPVVAAVKAAYNGIIAWADGKVIGAFPVAMQPGIAFLNYHLPLSETIFIVAALANLYLVCHALIFAIWTVTKLSDFAKAANGGSSPG